MNRGAGFARVAGWEKTMCRMFAAASKKMDKSYMVSFRELAARGKVLKDVSETHEDGWGISGYLGNWTVHFGRSEKGATLDKLYYFKACENAVRSGTKIVVSHLRQASKGGVNINNVHPFIYKEWIFCHNGTIFDAEKLKINNIYYEGTTDSEVFFKYLVGMLSNRSKSEFSAILENAANYIKENFETTSLTFLMSNGDHLFAFRDFTKDEYYYTLFYKKLDGGYVFCSEPLAGDGWTEMKNGQLMIVNKFGEIVFDKIIQTSALTGGPGQGYTNAENALQGSSS